MRVVSAVLAGFLLVGADATSAQDFGAPSPPIPPAEMINYCVYGGLVYSVGSQLCVVRGGPPLFCDQRPPDAANPGRSRAFWTTNQPPGTLNCANDPVGAGAGRQYR
jgi:hypothetical protein